MIKEIEQSITELRVQENGMGWASGSNEYLSCDTFLTAELEAYFVIELHIDGGDSTQKIEKFKRIITKINEIFDKHSYSLDKNSFIPSGKNSYKMKFIKVIHCGEII